MVPRPDRPLRLSLDKINLWDHACLCLRMPYVTPLSWACCSLDSGLFIYEFQSFEVLKDAIFPSRVYHRELHSLKQQVCVLKSELCKLQETLKVGIAKRTSPEMLSEKTIMIGNDSGSEFGYYLKSQAERLPFAKEEDKTIMGPWRDGSPVQRVHCSCRGSNLVPRTYSGCLTTFV